MRRETTHCDICGSEISLAIGRYGDQFKEFSDLRTKLRRKGLIHSVDINFTGIDICRDCMALALSNIIADLSHMDAGVGLKGWDRTAITIGDEK